MPAYIMPKIFLPNTIMPKNMMPMNVRKSNREWGVFKRRLRGIQIKETRSRENVIALAMKASCQRRLGGFGAASPPWPA